MSETRTVTPRESADVFLNLADKVLALAVATGQRFNWRVSPDGRGGFVFTLTVYPSLPDSVPDGDTTDFVDVTRENEHGFTSEIVGVPGGGDTRDFRNNP